MGRKKHKITHAAHIKRHTAGTSNEISFSVLDAAKDALEGGENKKSSSLGFGGISLFTLPVRRKKPGSTPTKERGLPLSTGDFASADKAPSSLARAPKQQRSPEEEIARRKAHRRLRKIVATAFVSVATVLLLGAGGLYLYHDYRDQQGTIMQLDEAFSLITQADKTIMALDVLVTDPFRDDAETTWKIVEGDMQDVEHILDEADKKARAASTWLRNSRDKEAANQAVAAVAARRGLIAAGVRIASEVQDARAAADRTQAAWSQVLEADDLARTAAQLVSDTTPSNVQASKDASNEALVAFGEARSSLEEAQAAYSQADLSALVGYVDKRIESLGYAIASDDAFLQKDKTEAAAQNEAYNTADAQAAALAKDIPVQPSTIVYDAYEQASKAQLEAYSTARLQAGTADAFIRDYLGAEIK